MSLITFSTTCFEKRGGPAAPSYPMLYKRSPGNRLMQNKGQINVKRERNSATKPWTPFNYNITFEINGKIIAVNIR